MLTDVIFDLDGTLTDPLEGITKSVQYSLKSFGIEVADHRELSYFIGPPLGGTFIEKFNFNEHQAKCAVEKYREYFAPKGIFENEVYTGIEDLLKELKNSGKRLFIATGKPTVFSKKIVEHFKLDKYFTAVYGIELSELNCSKKDTIKALINDFNIDPKTCVMVGDRIFDVEAGKINQMVTVGVKYGYAAEKELEGNADFIAETVEELNSILKSL